MRADKKDQVAEALRDAGYIPLPRLWVRSSDMPEIHRIAHQHREKVNIIRNNARSDNPVCLEEDKPEPPSLDPVDDKEAAWAAYDRMRNAG